MILDGSEYDASSAFEALPHMGPVEALQNRCDLFRSMLGRFSSTAQVDVALTLWSCCHDTKRARKKLVSLLDRGGDHKLCRLGARTIERRRASRYPPCKNGPTGTTRFTRRRRLTRS